MRFKYYLRGLGLGIIVSTVILMISVQIHGGIMTDERAIARATELGMIIPEEEPQDEGNSEQNTDWSDKEQELQNQELQNQAQQDQAQQDQAQQEQTQQENEQQSQTTADGENPDGDAETDEQEVIIFTVEDGEVCRTAAEKLVAFGLIEDVQEFRDFMRERDYDGLIREGTYEIPVGSDMETIGKIITAQNE